MSQRASPPPVLRSHPPDDAARHFEPLIRPGLAELYGRRAARLRALAEGHDLADYLRLAALVAETQAALLSESGLSESLVSDRTDPRAIAREGAWISVLDGLIERLRPEVSAPVAPHLAALRDLPLEERLSAALALAEGRFGAVPAAFAPFLWAALSLHCARVARATPLPERAPTEHASCPVCGAAPVASLILTGDSAGLRYLHCVLCESAWHMVRAKCTNCDTASDLDYLSFDTTEATVRAECCGECRGYLKVVSLERDPQAEAVADDLATLVLDDAVTAEGYQRTGFNPFALPQ